MNNTVIRGKGKESLLLKVSKSRGWAAVFEEKRMDTERAKESTNTKNSRM